MTTAQLVQLRNDIRSCTNCDLHKSAKAPVPWSGQTPARFLFIGMAPGVTEDRDGQPFVGSSGNKLRHWMKEAGFPADVAFANSVSCFPGRVAGGDAKPTRSQLLACRSNLTRQIDIIKPCYVFLVGGTALEAFRPDLTLTYCHGRPLYYDGREFNHEIAWAKFGIPMWTIYHPAAALRSRKYEGMIREDLASFWRWKNAGENWPDFCYVCGKDVEAYDAWGFGMCATHALRQGVLIDPA